MDKDSNEKSFSKKALILPIALVVSLFILFLLSASVFKSFSSKKCLDNYIDFAEKNEKTIFTIDKCTLFSSSDTKNKASSISNFTIENLYQFTDMAFYINNNSDEYNMENTLKSLSISNIKYSKLPEIGEPALYYKNFNDFAKSDIKDSNKIEDQLNFEVSSEDELSFDTPAIYNNCASPIVLSYVNSNIKSDYTFTDTTTPITYDGSLLKRVGVSLEELECNLSFDINITNNLDQKFKTTVFVNIPLKNEDESSSITDGKYTYKPETSYVFYRYE